MITRPKPVHGRNRGHREQTTAITLSDQVRSRAPLVW